MEIYTYLPAPLLKQAPEEMELDEFVETLAQARYVQQLKTTDIAIGVSKAFGE